MSKKTSTLKTTRSSLVAKVRLKIGLQNAAHIFDPKYGHLHEKLCEIDRLVDALRSDLVDIALAESEERLRQDRP